MINFSIFDEDGRDNLRRLHLAAVALHGVVKQYVRYCEQWEAVHGELTDGRALIYRNAKAALPLLIDTSNGLRTVTK